MTCATPTDCGASSATRSTRRTASRLSLRSQLAKSEELRSLEAWTKLQTVYSGDEASQ